MHLRPVSFFKTLEFHFENRCDALETGFIFILKTGLKERCDAL